MEVATLSQYGIVPLVIYSFWFAYKQRQTVLFLFLVFDAWLFEWIILLLLKEVSYSVSFSVDIGGVPLVIIFGWVILLFALYNLFQKINNPFLKAITIATIMVTIDLIMDIVAVNYGLWQWRTPVGYFGIPYSNFFGWYTYSLLVSLSISLFWKKTVWQEYVKMLLFITIGGLSVGGLWLLFSQYAQFWLWWVMYGGSIFFIIKNHKKIKIDNRQPSLLLAGAFVAFSVIGIMFSLHKYSAIELLFSGLWLSILIYFSSKRGMMTSTKGG